MYSVLKIHNWSLNIFVSLSLGMKLAVAQRVHAGLHILRMIHIACMHTAACPQSDLSVWCLHKLVLPEDVDQHHLGLHDCKPHGNAVARAPAEGHVAHLRTLGPLLWSESERRKQKLSEYEMYVLFCFAMSHSLLWLGIIIVQLSCCTWNI